jgi:hypothetical protein
VFGLLGRDEVRDEHRTRADKHVCGVLRLLLLLCLCGGGGGEDGDRHGLVSFFAVKPTTLYGD